MKSHFEANYVMDAGGKLKYRSARIIFRDINMKMNENDNEDDNSTTVSA